MRRIQKKRIQRLRRARRARARRGGVVSRARLSVFRSNRHIWVQLIDDASGTTIASASDREVTPTARSRRRPATLRERALEAGERIARQARRKGVGRARFDRGRYRYHGIVQAVAEGARRGGLEL